MDPQEESLAGLQFFPLTRLKSKRRVDAQYDLNHACKFVKRSPVSRVFVSRHLFQILAHRVITARAMYPLQAYFIARSLPFRTHIYMTRDN